MKLGTQYTAEEVIKHAELQYREMLEAGTWSGLGTSGSTFKTNGPLTCWNCGKEGHLSKHCRDPKKTTGTQALFPRGNLHTNLSGRRAGSALPQPKTGPM
jgi:hypothetical protein